MLWLPVYCMQDWMLEIYLSVCRVCIYGIWRGVGDLVWYGTVVARIGRVGGGGFFLLGLEARSRLEFVPPGK